jgi:protein-L-isoaspartate(D-aspartate) O-methyltransferase
VVDRINRCLITRSQGRVFYFHNPYNGSRMYSEEKFTQLRQTMVERQLRGRGIDDERVLEAMSAIPRHLFVPPAEQTDAYADCPLPIGHGQTISQPYIVALMTQLLQLKGSETVLEVGTGSGYQAAILAHLAKEIFTVERIAELAEQASERLKSLDLNNVTVQESDGTIGLKDQAPFDGILVTAAGPSVPPPLLDQLAPGGRLVIPVGARTGQMLEVWHNREGEKERHAIAPVAFVPLVGEHGWEEREGGFLSWLYRDK